MSLQHLPIDSNWTLFLDRDGVINRRIAGGYVSDWNQFEFLPGVLESIRKFSGIFGRIIVVSNQQGVGKGLMSEKEVNGIHLLMLEKVAENEGRIDAVYFSPHLESERSILRKPGIGMALRARKEFSEIRFKTSVMAGDSISDMVFGKRVGMKTVFLSEDPSPAKNHPHLINYCFPNLKSFANAL